MPSTPNNGNDFVYPAAERPLVIALKTISSKSLVQGESYRLRRFQVSNTNARIENLDGSNIRWIGQRGTDWEVLSSGSTSNSSGGQVTFQAGDLIKATRTFTKSQGAVTINEGQVYEVVRVNDSGNPIINTSPQVGLGVNEQTYFELVSGLVGTIARTTGISGSTISWANSNTQTGTVELANRGTGWEFVEFTDQEPDFFKEVVESVVLKVTGMANVIDPYFGTFNLNGFYKLASNERGSYFDGNWEVVPNAYNPAHVYEKVIEENCEEAEKAVFLYKYIHEGSDFLATRWEFGRTYPTQRDDLGFNGATGSVTHDTPFAESWATESNNECPTRPTPPSYVSLSLLEEPAAPSNVQAILQPPAAPSNVATEILPSGGILSFSFLANERLDNAPAAPFTGYRDSSVLKGVTVNYTWNADVQDGSGNAVGGWKRTNGANSNNHLDRDVIRCYDRAISGFHGKALYYIPLTGTPVQLSTLGGCMPSPPTSTDWEQFFNDIYWKNVTVMPTLPAAPSNVQATLPPPLGVYSFWLYAAQNLSGADSTPIIRLTSSVLTDHGAQYEWTDGLSINGGTTFSGWKRNAGANVVALKTQDFIYIHPSRGFEYWSGVSLVNFDLENFPSLPTGDNSFPFGTTGKYYFKNVSLTP